MKKTHLFLVWLFVATLTVANGQNGVAKNQNLLTFKKIPKESVFIHYNSPTLFTGETLKYKLYCLNLKETNLSTLSKIAYVELVGNDNNFVFKHKIKLNDGAGQGDYFIPTEVPSGNYKLIGYTKWMQNDGPTSFFHGDVMIINPYEKTSGPFDNRGLDSIHSDVGKTSVAATKKAATSSSTPVRLLIQSTIHKQREEVSLNISSSNGTGGYGHYSVSVRKIDDFQDHPIKTAQNYKSVTSGNQNKSDELLFLPELRGELISGKVVTKETGQPMANTSIALSIPGKAYVFNIVKTDDKGRFFFNLNSDYDGENAILQLVDNEHEGIITTQNHSSGDNTYLQFIPFRIDSQMKARIEERSIHSQIENAYSEVRQDSILPAEPNYPFFYDKSFDIFDLDDYTRFPTVRETFIEVVQHASIRNLNNRSEFHVLPSDTQVSSFYPPLIIVDGILVKDHTAIIEYGAKNIKRILVFREKYLYGSKGYQGALVFETLNGDYLQKMDKKDTYVTKLFKPEPDKRFFKQQYSTGTNKESDHIPDYRYQLLWKPDISLNSPEMTLDFYTSDVTGTFEISLEGFTFEGVPVSIREVIVVE